MDFRSRLFELRRKEGLSQEELADILGVTRQAVQKWEAGTSRPDMENLTALAGYFHVTLDYLVLGREQAAGDAASTTVINNYYGGRYHYEYKSRHTLFGIPLIHVNVGPGFCRARGIIAVGNIAIGIFSLGGAAVGLFTLGGLSIGLLLALGGLALGAVSVGGLAAGLMAWGGVAFGSLAVGGISCGMFAVGGIATGSRLAIGDIASGHLAIGPTAKGALTFAPPLLGSDLASAKAAIASVCGKSSPVWLVHLLQYFVEHLI